MATRAGPDARGRAARAKSAAGTDETGLAERREARKEIRFH